MWEIDRVRAIRILCQYNTKKPRHRLECDVFISMFPRSVSCLMHIYTLDVKCAYTLFIGVWECKSCMRWCMDGPTAESGET